MKNRLSIIIFFVALVLTFVPPTMKAIAQTWVCGDADGDGFVTIGDLTAILDYLLWSHREPASLEAADVDGCTGVDIGDLDALIMHYFDPSSPLNCSTIECSVTPTGSITLDHVDHLLDHNVIWVGEPETNFYLRITNDSTSHVAITNGFKIFSPDGATWGSLTAEVLDPGWESISDFVLTFGADGQGADTVGFCSWNIDSGQALLPPDFDEVVYKISLGYIDYEHEGKTIVLDTCFFPPGGTWKWGPSEAPSWDGPHYFSIEAPCPVQIIWNHCPESYVFSQCEVGTIDFYADDLCPYYPPEISEYKLLSGPGTIDPVTGFWTWSGPEVESGFYSVVVEFKVIVNEYITKRDYCGVNVEVTSTGEPCVCCVGLTGNVDGDPEDICDIGDLMAFIDYLFITFTAPGCMEEANCDGSPDGIIDIGDLTALIDYLFITFTPTAECL